MVSKYNNIASMEDPMCVAVASHVIMLIKLLLQRAGYILILQNDQVSLGKHVG